MSRRLLILIAAVGIAFTFIFQNCSSQKSGDAGSATIQNAAGGGGEPYEGKLYASEAVCGDGTAKARILFWHANAASLLRQDCQDLKPEIPLTEGDFQVGGSNAEFLIYRGQVFHPEQAAPPPPSPGPGPSPSPGPAPAPPAPTPGPGPSPSPGPAPQSQPSPPPLKLFLIGINGCVGENVTYYALPESCSVSGQTLCVSSNGVVEYLRLGGQYSEYLCAPEGTQVTVTDHAGQPNGN